MVANIKDNEDWAGVAVKRGPAPEQRLAELKAKAPVKRKKVVPFAKIGLASAARAFSALKSQKAMVWVWLVHSAWKKQRQTVTVPNGELAKLGVSREVKRRALQQLEAAGLILIDRPSRKSPTATLL